MEKNEISIHQIKVVNALRSRPNEWLSNKDISGFITDVSERTVRMHTLRLVNLGLVDQAEVFPAHRYQWSGKAKQRNAGYLLRLDKAAAVMGIQQS